MEVKRALTIAGSDSGGGAGIQADLKTFTAHGVFGMSVITSITAQNTTGVLGVYDLPPDFVELQFKAVMEDIGTDVFKTGMLSTKEIIEAVGRNLRKYPEIPLVVDPVMRAKGGNPLLRPDAEEALIREIVSIATVVTPNIPEAERLSGIKIRSLEDMRKAAEKIKEFGPKYVLLKGGHLESDEAVDILYDGRDFKEYRGKKIKTKNTHGTGCTFASAIASNLALGYSVEESVERAKKYIEGAIQNSFSLGKGHGPLNHFYQFAK